jgi:hypothetical protein
MDTVTGIPIPSFPKVAQSAPRLGCIAGSDQILEPSRPLKFEAKKFGIEDPCEVKNTATTIGAAA